MITQEIALVDRAAETYRLARHLVYDRGLNRQSAGLTAQQQAALAAEQTAEAVLRRHRADMLRTWEGQSI